MKTAIELIAEERKRQISEEGWTLQHDDKYTQDQLKRAASCYLLVDLARRTFPDEIDPNYCPDPEIWPWDPRWWKPTPDNPIKELVKAGALIVAEIERLQRLEK